MSLIRDIRIIPLEFRLGAGEGYGSARGITNSRGGGLVILETEDGVHGIGEAWGPAAVSRAYLEMVKPLYVGRSVFAQRGAAAYCRHQRQLHGRRCAGKHAPHCAL